MTPGAAWSVLVLAGLFEVAWAIGLKYTDGFTRLGPVVFTLAAMAASVVLLARTVRVLPVGTAYAVWTGIGVLGTAALAILLFGESASPMRLAGIGLILLGMVLLKLAASA